MCGQKGVAGAQQDGAFDNVFQLAHVAAPLIFLEKGQRFFGDGVDGFIIFPAVFVHEIFSQHGNVFRPLPEGGQLNGNDVQPIVQILAKLVFFHQGFRIAVGGGDDPHINRNRFAAAHFIDFMFLQNAQEFGLQGQAQFRHLVQQ